MIHNCLQCGVSFSFTDASTVLLKKISPVINGKQYPIPTPSLCPDCRRQRRLAFRNERSFHKRTCDFCKKSIIAVYPQESEYKVYCRECWWSDHWDSLAYGRPYDFNRPFFEQYHELCKALPHIAIHNDGTSENCEYVNYGMNNKSCYLSLCAFSEDIYYSHGAFKSRSCLDCTKVIESELCYECIDVSRCYQLFFSQDCVNCSESWFLKDCQNARHCFASSGLRNREFVFENFQLSKEDYEARIKKITLTVEGIQNYLAKRNEISLQMSHRAVHGMNNENATGDFIDNCKNVESCFDCIGLEDSAYCDTCVQAKDLMGCSYTGLGSELSYEINGSNGCQRSMALYYTRTPLECFYCQYCYESQHLFGCQGLKRKKFCIFNLQYSEEEYYSLLPKIVAQIQETGEWGQFFPISISPFPHNETVAFEYFPVTEDQARAKGWQWAKLENPETKSFRMIKQELDFYQRFGLPAPTLHPDIRHRNRLAKRNSRKLWERACSACGKPIRTTFSPDRPEKIFCEPCYEKAVY